MQIQQVISFSIAIGSVIGMVRFKKISPLYQPFLVLLWIGFANEILNKFLIYHLHTYNIVNTNIYCLLEALFIAWQFNRWKLFENNRTLYRILIAVIVVFWVINSFWIGSFTKNFSSFFFIFYAYVIVLMSISMVNKLIVQQKENLVKNAAFILSIAFIIFFTYQILVETFWWYGLNEKNFRVEVYKILQFVNLFVNLIFALAVLCMPNKPKFILQS